MAELAYTATWSARFIIPIPDVIVVAQEAVSGEIAYAEEKF
jgi:hypothetical protein